MNQETIARNRSLIIVDIDNELYGLSTVASNISDDVDIPYLLNILIEKGFINEDGPTKLAENKIFMACLTIYAGKAAGPIDTYLFTHEILEELINEFPNTNINNT